jgi:hypothetical protein
MAVYFGGGPAVNVYNYDNTDDNVGPGVNFVGGLKLNQGLFFEVKFGVIDSPEFKLTVGYAFR